MSPRADLQRRRLPGRYRVIVVQVANGLFEVRREPRGRQAELERGEPCSRLARAVCRGKLMAKLARSRVCFLGCLIFVGGCNASTSQDLGQCRLDAYSHFSIDQISNSSDAYLVFVSVCMQAHRHQLDVFLDACKRAIIAVELRGECYRDAN